MNINNSQNVANPRPAYGLWVIAALLVAEAIATSIYIPQYSELFEGFGAELPFLTKAVLLGAWGFWILPFIAFVVIAFAPKAKSPTTTIVIFLFVVGILWVPVAIYGLYLPVWEMAEVNPS